MVFVSHEVPFSATSDRKSRMAGNCKEWVVKTMALSSPTSGDEQWVFSSFWHGFLNCSEIVQIKKSSFLSAHLHLLVKTIRLFLFLTRCHYQPFMTFGHSWLKMAPHWKQKTYNFEENTSNGEQKFLTCVLLKIGEENSSFMQIFGSHEVYLNQTFVFNSSVFPSYFPKVAR